MSPTLPTGSDDFREHLSAWHDGALPDEASRFVLKRLLQDEALRAEVGRWQAVGDVLRRQSQARPGVGLPERVAATVAKDAPARPRGAPRAWGRVAWASAAAIGLFAVLLMPTGEPVTAPPAVVVAAPASAIDARESLARPAVSAARPVLLVADAAAVSRVAQVPPLVRAPQPTPEQLAPLPPIDIDAPSRPWPRHAGGNEAYVVDYVVPASAAPPRP